MNKLYAVVNEDGHADTDIEIYSHFGEARIRLTELVLKYARSIKDITENNYQGYLVHYTYSGEGDCVYILELTSENGSVWKQAR